MLQQALVKVTFEQYRKPTRREQFLNEMNRLVPWTGLVAVFEPIYSKAV
jgi:IS5 family transposase